MLSAPAPNSNAGSGSQSPLRTKPPTVVRYESGRTAVGASGRTAAMPSQYLPPSTILFRVDLGDAELGRELEPGEAERIGRRHHPRRDRDAELGHQAAESRSAPSPSNVDTGDAARCVALDPAAFGQLRNRVVDGRAEIDQLEIVLVRARATFPGERGDPDGAQEEGQAPRPWKGHCRVRYGLASKGVKEAASLPLTSCAFRSSSAFAWRAGS